MQSGPLLRYVPQQPLLCQPLLSGLPPVFSLTTRYVCYHCRRAKRLIAHVGDAAALLQPQADAQLDGGPAHINGCAAHPLIESIRAVTPS